MTDFRCTLFGTYGGAREWSTRLHITSADTEAALAGILQAAWIDAWNNGTYGLKTLYATSVVATQVKVKTLNATMHELSVTPATVAITGTNVGESLPWSNSIVVSLRSNFIAKRNRGRMYLPAPAVGEVSGNLLSSTAQTRVKDAMTALFTAIRADGSQVFVYNAKPATGGTVPAFTKTTITSEMVSNKVGQQRRRVKSEVPTYM